MHKKPLITLATVTLNNANGLEKTWNSIRQQDSADYEWLVQDGESTDDSLKYLATTTAVVESKPDNGIYDAMNRLIERSNGYYILFLNAGDSLATLETLTTIVTHIRDKNPDFVYGDALEDTQDGERYYKPARNHKNLARGMFTHHQSMLYNQKAINELRYDMAYKIAADYDFTCRFLIRNNTATYIPEPICVFEPGGISQQHTKTGREEQFQIRRNLALCGIIQNQTITSIQSIIMLIRTIAPNVYWCLKHQKP